MHQRRLDLLDRRCFETSKSNHTVANLAWQERRAAGEAADFIPFGLRKRGFGLQNQR